MGDEREVELPGPTPGERGNANAGGHDAADASSAQRPSLQELKRILARDRGWPAKHQGDAMVSHPLPVARRGNANAGGHDATDASSAQRPSLQELKRILARHRGWLANQHGDEMLSQPLSVQDIYLETIEPAYPDWRDEALSSPARAILIRGTCLAQT